MVLLNFVKMYGLTFCAVKYTSKFGDGGIFVTINVSVKVFPQERSGL